MNVLVTAGPTREPIDTVRFITTASSGRMGYACAAAAAGVAREVTLITGPTAIDPPAGVEVVEIVTVAELAEAVEKRFALCDALIMAAAVGDFTVADPSPSKIPRAGGPVTITLVPTDDILAGVAAAKRPGQIVVGFAVEADRNEAKAYEEMMAKHCDYLVLNGPAAMGAEASEACILSADGLALDWARRHKSVLAREIVALLGQGKPA